MQLRQDMSRFMLLLLATGLIALCASSCDSGSNGSGTPAEDTSAEDTPSPDDTQDDVAVVPSYPEGPYGVIAGETIDDLGFYNPVTEEMEYLNQWYQHPKIKLLMLVSTAAW